MTQVDIELLYSSAGIWLPMLHVDLSEVAYIIEGKATETTPVNGSSMMRFLLSAAAQSNDCSAQDVVVMAGMLHRWVIIQYCCTILP